MAVDSILAPAPYTSTSVMLGDTQFLYFQNDQNTPSSYKCEEKCAERTWKNEKRPASELEIKSDHNTIEEWAPNSVISF